MPPSTTSTTSAKARATANTSIPASLVPTTPPSGRVLKTAQTVSGTFASQAAAASDADASASVSIPVGIFGGTAGLPVTNAPVGAASNAGVGSTSASRFPVIPVAAGAGGVVLLVLAGLAFCFCIRRRRAKRQMDVNTRTRRMRSSYITSLTPEPRGANDSMEKSSIYGTAYSPERQQPAYGTRPGHHPDPYQFSGSAY